MKASPCALRLEWNKLSRHAENWFPPCVSRRNPSLKKRSRPMKPSCNDSILPARPSVASDGGLRLVPPGDGWIGGRLAVPVRRAIGRTRSWLLGQQRADGSWCAELEGDTILESETILLLAFLGREHSALARPPGQSAASRSSCPTAAGRCFPAARWTSAAASRPTSP